MHPEGRTTSSSVELGAQSVQVLPGHLLPSFVAIAVLFSALFVSQSELVSSSSYKLAGSVIEFAHDVRIGAANHTYRPVEFPYPSNAEEVSSEWANHATIESGLLALGKGFNQPLTLEILPLFSEQTLVTMDISKNAWDSTLNSPSQLSYAHSGDRIAIDVGEGALSLGETIRDGLVHTASVGNAEGSMLFGDIAAIPNFLVDSYVRGIYTWISGSYRVSELIVRATYALGDLASSHTGAVVVNSGQIYNQAVVAWVDSTPRLAKQIIVAQITVGQAVIGKMSEIRNTSASVQMELAEEAVVAVTNSHQALSTAMVLVPKRATASVADFLLLEPKY